MTQSNTRQHHICLAGSSPLTETAMNSSRRASTTVSPGNLPRAILSEKAAAHNEYSGFGEIIPQTHRSAFSFFPSWRKPGLNQPKEGDNLRKITHPVSASKSRGGSLRERRRAHATNIVALERWFSLDSSIRSVFAISACWKKSAWKFVRGGAAPRVLLTKLRIDSARYKARHSLWSARSTYLVRGSTS